MTSATAALAATLTLSFCLFWFFGKLDTKLATKLAPKLGVEIQADHPSTENDPWPKDDNPWTPPNKAPRLTFGPATAPTFEHDSWDEVDLIAWCCDAPLCACGDTHLPDTTGVWLEANEAHTVYMCAAWGDGGDTQ